MVLGSWQLSPNRLDQAEGDHHALFYGGESSSRDSSPEGFVRGFLARALAITGSPSIPPNRYPPSGGNSQSPINNFNSQEQSRLRQLFSSAGLQEIYSLSEESDWEIFFNDLIHLGRRQLRHGREDSARLIFATVVQGLAEEFPGRPANHEQIAAVALRELDALEGRGPLGPRLELVGSHFLRDVTEPISLASMVTAGLSYGSVRMAAFAGLGRLRAGSFFARPLVAQATATGLGFGAEVLAFSVTGRGLRTLAGQPLDWSGEALSRELVGTTLMLGMLKSSGALSRSLLGRPAWNPSRLLGPQGGMLQRLPYKAIPQGAMLLGIMGAHRVEESLGWRPHRDGSGLLFESLVTLLHFNAAGKIINGVLGPRYMQLNHQFHLQGERFRQELIESFRQGGSRIFSPQALTPGGFFMPLPDRSPPRSRGMFMVASGDGEGKGSGSWPGVGRRRFPTLTGPAPDPGRAPTQNAPGPSKELSSPPASLDFEIQEGMEFGNGAYRVLQKLGAGGMGEVWQLQDNNLPRHVVMKIPHPELRSTLMSRFETEYNLQAILPREWRVEIFDILEIMPGLRVPIMEYVPGRDLLGLISDLEFEPELANANYPIAKRTEIFAEICEGIQATHDLGVVHRDLKPDNIRLTEEGRIRILDYGIARRIWEVELPQERKSIPQELMDAMDSHRTRTGFTVGTPGYIAPEFYIGQARGAKFDPRLGDVYALGVVLYELVSGRPPYAQYTAGNSLAGEPELVPRRDAMGRELFDRRRILQILPEHAPPAFDKVMVGMSDPIYSELESIARRAMSPRPYERYQSVEELRQAVLMAEPKVERSAQLRLKSQLERLEAILQESSPNFQRSGEHTPQEKLNLLEMEEEARYIRDTWLEMGSNLVTNLKSLTRVRPFPEAQRMIADISWEQLTLEGSRLHPLKYRNRVERILENDVPYGEVEMPSMGRALLEGVPVKLQLGILGQESTPAENVKVRVITLERESNPQGIETGNFQEKGWVEISQTGLNPLDLTLRAGHFVFEFRSPGYATMRVPVQLGLEDIRSSLVQGEPLAFSFDLVPLDRVPEGSVVIHRTRGTIGHNFYLDGDTASATSFPRRPYEIKTLAITRDPITVNEYREFIEDLLRQNDQTNRHNSKAYLEGAESIQQQYFPRTPIPSSARDLNGIGARMWNLFRKEEGEARYYWQLAITKTKLGRVQDIRLIDPTSHNDPFDDPIFGDHPISAISYDMAEAYVQWRSQRDGVSYRIPLAEELELIARNGFDWRFPWGNGTMTDSHLLSRGSFLNPTLEATPQRVGFHPQGTSRDRSLHGVREMLGNVREFTSTPVERQSLAIFGGSIRLNLGKEFSPSTRYLQHRGQFKDSIGAFRLVLDLENPESP